MKTTLRLALFASLHQQTTWAGWGAGGGYGRSTRTKELRYFRGLITTNDTELHEIPRLRENKIRGDVGAQ